jgi:predicted metal-dependent peptidase
MEHYLDNRIQELQRKSIKLIQTFSKASTQAEKFVVTMPEDFQRDFFSLIDQVNLSLMEDENNFYGYFLFQMSKEIRYDISSPTAVNFKGARYVIYFNPLLFLKLNIRQMQSSIQHEILHILSLHLIRAVKLKSRFHKAAIEMAMDIVVNVYLDHLPPYATTLEWVNKTYSLKLKPYQPFEYYVEELNSSIDFPRADKDKSSENRESNDTIKTEYEAGKTHDIWDESDLIDESTQQEFTEKILQLSRKGEIPTHVKVLIDLLKSSKGELPWNLYLNRLMGTVESNPKKTITRRDRRQPDRLDLRGQLRSHKANIAVAIDISGSISDEEFKQALKEVLGIVKNHSHEITVIECDNEIRRVYPVKSVKDFKDRLHKKGSTKFSPVFEYANQHKMNLLVYFTDGKGEEKLSVIPHGYHVLWVISGRGEGLSVKNPYGIVKKLSYVEVKDTILDITDVKSGGFSMMHQERFI